MVFHFVEFELMIGGAVQWGNPEGICVLKLLRTVCFASYGMVLQWLTIYERTKHCLISVSFTNFTKSFLKTGSIFSPSSITGKEVAGKDWPITTVGGENLSKPFQKIQKRTSKIPAVLSLTILKVNSFSWPRQVLLIFIVNV